MPLRKIFKRNRAGLQPLFTLVYLGAFGLIAFLAVLKSDLTREMTLGEAKWLVVLYGIFGASVFISVVIRQRALIYLGAMTWSRRFGQLTLIAIVLPLLVVLLIGSVFFVGSFFPMEMETFWDQGRTKGLFAVGLVVGIDLYILTLIYFCVLGWRRGVRCGSKSSNFSATTTIPLMVVAIAVYVIVVSTVIGNLAPQRPASISNPSGEFHSEPCRRLMISGC